MARSRPPLPDGDPRHGTENGYVNYRCHCDLCTKAHADEYREGLGRARRDRFRHGGSGDLKARYRMAREAGFSAAESRRRSFWSDPLRPS